MAGLSYSNQRIEAVDIIRGLVMIVMALDHTRDLIHVDALKGDPTDLATTTSALFLTRWITHLCAPTFVFLSGTSAYLSYAKNGDVAVTRNFLISRGVWLILLEFTVVTFGVWFDIRFSVFLIQVIFAIGFGFIALGLLLRLKPSLLGWVGISMIVGHQLFLLIPFEPESLMKQLLEPLFISKFFPISESRSIIVGYPPIPWLGIMLAGFGSGRYFAQPGPVRQRFFLFCGLLLLSFFLLFRYFNLYGDPRPWTEQESPLFSIFSFLNVSKYPPSLHFCMLMLGIMFLLLFIAEKLPAAVSRILATYGKVPLFYYLIHWYLIHITLFAILIIQGFTPSEFEFGFNFGRPSAGGGLSLGVVYLIWIGIVTSLYPVCRWYGAYKQRNHHKRWLKYL